MSAPVPVTNTDS